MSTIHRFPNQQSQSSSPCSHSPSPHPSPSMRRNGCRGRADHRRGGAGSCPGAGAVPSWDETSGYGSVEASRAAIGHDDGVSDYRPTGHEAAAAMGLSWDDTSGYGSVEASRAEVSALLSGELISGQGASAGFCGSRRHGRGTRRAAMGQWRQVARRPPLSTLPSPVRPGTRRVAMARSRRVVPRWR